MLPYLKASVEDDGGLLELSTDDSPVLEPYVGTLLISYVLDEGATLRLITEGERRAAGVSIAELHRRALANLSRKIALTGVRLVPYGQCVAVLFDGNFEATLLLWDDLWPQVHAHLGPELVAAAPARDLLAVSSPAGASELRDVISRAWPNGDHLLTRDLYRRTSDGWSFHRVE